MMTTRKKMFLAAVLLGLFFLARTEGPGGLQPLTPSQPSSHQVPGDGGPDPCPWEGMEFGPRLFEGQCRTPA